MTESLDDWRGVMQQVILRALCDALGFTNISPTKNAHMIAVREAQAWFIEPDEGGQFDGVCEIAGFNPDRIRKIAKELIHARWTGDHSRVAPFWRMVFAEERMPSLTNIERALDALADAP